MSFSPTQPGRPVRGATPAAGPSSAGPVLPCDEHAALAAECSSLLDRLDALQQDYVRTTADRDALREQLGQSRRYAAQVSRALDAAELANRIAGEQVNTWRDRSMSMARRVETLEQDQRMWRRGLRTPGDPDAGPLTSAEVKS